MSRSRIIRIGSFLLTSTLLAGIDSAAAQVNIIAERPLAVYAKDKITEKPFTTLIVGDGYTLYDGGGKFCAIVSDTFGFIGYTPTSLLKIEVDEHELEEYDLESVLETKAVDFVGRQVWTKWDILYIDGEGGLLGGLRDEIVTRYKSGNVIYQSQGSGEERRKISTTSSRDFANQFSGVRDEEVDKRRKQSAEENAVESIVSGRTTLRLAGRGSPLTIGKFKYKLKLGSQRVEIQLRDPFKKDLKAWLYPDNGYGLSPSVFESLLSSMFSFVDPNYAVEISLGMSIEELIRLKGEPITRINLGPKTILTYEDVKFIFEEGALVDAQ